MNQSPYGQFPTDVTSTIPTQVLNTAPDSVRTTQIPVSPYPVPKQAQPENNTDAE